MSTQPPNDAVTDRWWAATRQRRLFMQACAGCAALQHPPRPICLSCFGTALGWREMAGTGRIDAWTVVHRSPGPGFDPPYVLARVRLDEGPVLLTRLGGGPQHRCGDRVTVAWQPLPDGRHLPLFTPLVEATET